MAVSNTPLRRPKALLFDIGGVVVQSPFRAILDYEHAHDIPTGYINHAISASAPNGSWQRLERGEIPLDDAFFAAFAEDLGRRDVWEGYLLKKRTAREAKRESGGGGSGGSRREQQETQGYALADAKDVAVKQVESREERDEALPPPPRIETKPLFWSMMRLSRFPDPHMYPLLLRLRSVADSRKGNKPDANDNEAPFLLAALSNTVAFPAGIRDENGNVFDTGLNLSQTPPTYDNNTTTIPQSQQKHLPTLFDTFLSSAHLGQRKPSASIYALALRELDTLSRARGLGPLEPGDVLFLDDIGQNLRAAREAGMRTLKVEMGRTEGAAEEVGRVMGVGLGVGKARL